MSSYPAPDLYTPMIFNQASYKTSSETPLSSYLRKAGGEIITNVETFSGGIKTDTVKDVAGNSLLTTTGLGANIVSSSLKSVGTLGGGTDTLSTANTLLKVARSSRSTDPIASFTASQNTTANDKTKIDFGVNNSSKNSGSLSFNYSGNSSNENTVFLGFNGGTGLSMNNQNSTNGTLYYPGTLQLAGPYPNQMLQISTATDNVYLDFHSKTAGSNSSYDARISSSGGSSSTSGQADLTVLAKSISLPTLTASSACYLGGPYPNQMVEIATGTDLAYIDFHSKASNTGKHDARIISSGGTVGSDEKGALSIAANSLSLPPAKFGGSTFKQFDSGYQAGGSATGTVNFGFTFANVPAVTCTIAQTSQTQVFSVQIHTVGQSSFQYSKTFIYTSGAAGGQANNEGFYWIALG